MKTSKHILSMLLILAMLVGCLAGCGGSASSGSAPDSGSSSGSGASDSGSADKADGSASDGSSDAGYAKDNQTVVIACTEEPGNISAFNHSTLSGAYFNRLTFNGLMCFDHDLNPVCDLADSYEVKEGSDGKLSEWYFYLRQGVKFHDGSEMHAEDVVASLNTAKNTPECAMFTRSYTGVEEVDEYTVKITTDGENSSLLSDLCIHSNYICPKALLDSGWDFNNNPIGTGPYKFVDWTISDSLTFEVFDDYFKTENAPRISNVIFKIMPESTSRTISLETGVVDYVIDFDTNEVERISAEDNNISVLTTEGTGHNFLVFNTEVEPFDDVNLRKAINCCINKEDVITVALNGNGQVALSCAPNGMLGATNDNTETYSLDKANEYLEAWGGDPSALSFEIVCKNETHKRAAEVVQEALRQIGISCTVATYDLSTYSSMTSGSEYVAAMASWTTETIMGYLNGNFNSSAIGSTNRARWNDPDTDELIAKVCGTVDDSARAGFASECIARLNEYQVTVPIYQNNIVSAANSHLKGVDLQAAGNLYVDEWYWD